MTIKIINCKAWGNRVGLKITGPLDVDVQGSDFSGNSEAGIIVSDDLEPLLTQLSLPTKTPPRLLRKLLIELAAMRHEPQSHRTAVVRKSELLHWLRRVGHTAINLTTLAANLATWAATPQGQQLLNKLGV